MDDHGQRLLFAMRHGRIVILDLLSQGEASCCSASFSKSPAERKPGGALVSRPFLFFFDNLADRIHRFTNAAADMALGLFGLAFVFKVSVANCLAGLFLDRSRGLL